MIADRDVRRYDLNGDGEWLELEPTVELERALWRDTERTLALAFCPLAVTLAQVFGVEVPLPRRGLAGVTA